MTITVDIGASVIARLKNKARREKLQLQLLLNLFCQEEFLRRIGKSRFSDNFILKGGFLLYTLSGFKSRPTMDADYLLKNQSNDIGNIEEIILEITSISGKNDFIKFEIKNLKPITEQREYNGIRVNMIGYIRNTKTPFSIDIGVGDVVVPPPGKIDLPVLLDDFEKPNVLTYSLETTIAEKLDSIISRMELTSRMKDFFDIYYLANTNNFEARKIQEAIFETLQNRHTAYEKDTISEISNLVNDKDILLRWESFCKKTLKFDLNFKEIILEIVEFIEIPFKAILEEDETFDIWNHEQKQYVKMGK
jgi:predicted nucleotidyltransferase component of viral defense system